MLFALVQPEIINTGVSDIPSSSKTAFASHIETNQAGREEDEEIGNVPLSVQEDDDEFEEDLFESSN